MIKLCAWCHATPLHIKATVPFRALNQEDLKGSTFVSMRYNVEKLNYRDSLEALTSKSKHNNAPITACWQKSVQRC